VNSLFISPSSHSGGGQRWLETLVSRLPEYDINPSIIFSKFGHPGTIFHHKLEKYLVDYLCYSYSSASYAEQVSKYINEHNISIVIIEHDEKIGLIRENCDCKVVFVNHTEDSSTIGEINSNWDVIKHVVCVSERIKKNVLAQLPELSDAGYRAVSCIKNTVPTPPSIGFDVREFMGIPKEAFVVGYLGRIDANKGVSIIPRMLDKVKNLYGLVVGPGNVKEFVNYSKKNPRLKVFNSDITYVGDWYKAMDVFVLNSRAEGYPLAPMEAMLCGTAIATTDVSDLREDWGHVLKFFEHDNVRNAIEVLQYNHKILQEVEPLVRNTDVDKMISSYAEVFRGLAE
jgi:glycosyltransferase involved in cell wall biosynthesis